MQIIPALSSLGPWWEVGGGRIPRGDREGNCDIHEGRQVKLRARGKQVIEGRGREEEVRK